MYEKKEPILLKILRRLKFFYVSNGETEKFTEYKNENANNFLFNLLEKSENGFMVTKFGTYELENFCCFYGLENKNFFKDFYYAMKNLKNFSLKFCFPNLCHNAGFFPYNYELGNKWYKLVQKDLKYIDVFGSSQKLERYILNELKKCIKINLQGYVYPFLYKSPWTKYLENKNVLVIHPFKDSIESQYKNREFLFENKDVLPSFKSLKVIKAVQSIAGNKTEFETWFDALKYMEDEIDKVDFDIALIGCGAYGMNLAAYCKRKGKIAIHMASHVQLLFGVYGTRWEKDPLVSKFINKYWIKPNENEKPQNFQTIENGCYW